MKTDLGTLRDKLEINRDRLDEELIRQPQLFFEASEAYAHAVDRRESAKDALKQVGAEVYLKFRRDSESEHRKLTEAMIQAEVETDRVYAQAKNKLTTAVAAVEVAEALKDAFSQRGYMLRELCGLYTAGYFSKNSVNGENATRVKDQGYERVRAEMADRRNKARV